MSSFVSPNPGDVIASAHVRQFAHTLGGGQTSAVPIQVTGLSDSSFAALSVRNKAVGSTVGHFTVLHSTNGSTILRVSDDGVAFPSGTATSPGLNFGSTTVGMFRSAASSNEALVSVASSGVEMLRFGTFWLGSSANTNYGLVIGASPAYSSRDMYNFAFFAGKDDDDPLTGKNKLMTRSILLNEFSDAVDVGRRRTQGSLTNPRALDYRYAGGSTVSVEGSPAGYSTGGAELSSASSNANNRIIARDYAQGWDGTSWAASGQQGWHASINWHIQQTPTQLNRGGGIAFAVTRNNPGVTGSTAVGFQVPRERLWINHLGQVVISGRAAVEPSASEWGEEASLSGGISMDNYNPQGWFTLIATRDGDTTHTTDRYQNLQAWRNNATPNDGVNLRMTSSGLGHMTWYKCSGVATDTSVIPLDLAYSTGGAGIGGRATATHKLTVYGSVGAKQPAARVWNSGAIQIAHNTITTIPFNVGVFQTNSSMWSSAASSGQRLVAQAAGVYRMSGNVFWNTNSSGTRSLRLLKNGSSVIGLDARPPVAATQTAQIVSAEYVLAAGDYVELAAFQDSGSTASIASQATYSPTLSLTYLGST